MKKECFECGELIKEEDLIYTGNGDLVCSSCIDDDYFQCEKCGEYHRIGSSIETTKDGLICQDCYDDDYFTCDDCGDVLNVNDSVSYETDNGDVICENCRENYISCEDCGALLYEDSDYIHYNDSDDCWYCDSCYESHDDDNDDYIFEYHSGEGHGDLSNGYRYRIGFEIEKEDRSVKEDMKAWEFLDETHWVKEEDGSLDGYEGFETISPILPLKISELKKEFKKENIKKVICARHSDRCGGHITISDTERTSVKIIDDIAGYFLILYALYPNRVYNGYCGGSVKDNYKEKCHRAVSTRDERTSIYSLETGEYTYRYDREKGAGVEIRLFPPPKDEKDLLLRSRLLRYALTHSCTSLRGILNELLSSKILLSIVKQLADMEGLEYEEFFDNIITYSKQINKSRVNKTHENLITNIKRKE